jgi:hypothetical protein
MKVFLLLILLLTLHTVAQNSNRNVHKAFDEVIGLKNTDLSYGKLFYEKYRTLKDNNQYFLKNEFVKGDVTYQNQIFYDVLIKYDLAEDNLIVNLPSTFENRSIILEKYFLEKFTLQNSTFLNLKNHGLHELLFSSNGVILYKKWIKLKKKKLNKSFVYYKFIEENFYSLRLNNNYYEINNKKDIIKIFPNQKKLISSFFKSNKGLYKNDLDTFYLLLSEKISSNIVNN